MPSFVQKNGKYYLTKGTSYTDSYSKEIELGKWYTIKFELGNEVVVYIDGQKLYAIAYCYTWDIFRFQKGNDRTTSNSSINQEIYVDDFKVVGADGTVVEYNFDNNAEADKWETTFGSTTKDKITVGVETLVTAIPAISENFDSTTVGTLPEGFTVSNSDKASVEHEKSFTNALHIVNNKTASNNWDKTAFLITNGTSNGCVEFDIKFQQVSQPIWINIIVGGKERSLTLSKLDDGNYYFYNQQRQDATKTQFNLGEWIHLKFTIDSSNVKVTINDVTSFGLRASGSGQLQKIQFQTDAGCEYYVDNFKADATPVYMQDFEGVFDINTLEKDATCNNGTVSVALVEASVNEESGKALYVEDNTSDAVVNAAVALEGREKAEIGFSYKAEKLADGHIFAVKDAAGNNKVVLRAMPVSAEKAKLQYLAANGEYVDIKNSEFNIGEWNELKLTVYSNYDNADLSLGGVALGEVYSDIGVNKLATFEMGSASVQGASDIFCIDNLSVASSTVEDIEIIPGDFISPETGKECAHRFNIGGYCKMCGALGNPVTFSDGNSGKALTAGEGIYSQIDYDQFWDYLDTDGLLLGNDFMFAGKFTFNEWDNQEADGNTRLFTLANGEVNDTNAYLAVELYTNNNKLEMGISAEERVALRLGTEYDIRVAVRAATSADGNYSNRAEIYLNDQLLWIKEFTISGENAIGVRLGDNVARSSMVKYDVKNDFGIFFLDNSIEYIGMQEKEDANYEEDSAFDLRFVFGLDDLYLEDVGIKVDAAISGGSTIGNTDGSITASSYRNVFDAVSVGEEICKPVVNGAGGGGYYLALAIKDVELDTTATYTFTLTPYIKLHETEAESFMPYSYEITVSFENSLMKVDFEEIK